MEETKKALRSLLVSSPLMCTVEKLNQDYKEFMGFFIPFRELGFNSLLDLLHAMTDVLLVNGNSMKSQVTLIVSEKTAHVNDMVLKQKTKSQRRSSKRPTRYSNFGNLPRTNLFKNYSNDSTTRNNSMAKKSPEVCNRNDNSHSLKPGVNDISSRNNSVKSPNITYKNEENVEKLQVPHVEDIPKLMDINVKLPTMTELHLGKSDLHYLHRPDYNSISETQCENEIQFEKLTLDKDDDDFMRQLLFKKDIYNKSSRNILSNTEKFTKKDGDKDVSNNRVPHSIQENLKCLIAKFSEGLWCSDLPGEYKKEFNESFHYEDMGYRCLINMCMDLQNIFVCSKESSCDFKLYDIRRPLMKPAAFQKFSTSLPQQVFSPEGPLPKLDWNNYSSLIPKDVLTLGEEIPREFFETSVNKEEIVRVVVAEIYDISKFWLYKDDGKLDGLMDRIQEFYRQNDEKYLIPEDLLAIGLYCAAVTLNEFHRAVIIGLLETSVKVFFIDYGSLGLIPKNQVWFLKKCFSKLPAQAIRARLAHIYPPVENTTWSREAIGMFKRFANMKSLNARIQNVIIQKKIVEVYLENNVSLPGHYLNNFLCSNGLALMINKERHACIDDPHCVPKVKYLHLFPTFDEIEYWLVPSVENIISLSGMKVSPDLFLPQYFSRTSDNSLLDRIEKRARKKCLRREKLTKCIDLKMFDSVVNMETMEKIFYGDAYVKYEEEEEAEDDADSNVEMCVFLNKLRRKRMNNSELSQNADDRSPTEQGGSKNYMNDTNDENDDIAKEFYGSAFVEETKEFNKAERSRWSQLNPQNLLELERYLSEDSDCSYSPLSPKLVDLDDSSSSSSSEADYSKNIEKPSDNPKSSKDSLYSLSVSSSRSGIESMEPSSMLNNTIEHEQVINSNDTTNSDLIKLDVIIDNPITTQNTTSNELWSRNLEISSSDPFGCLNEENCSLSGDIFPQTGISRIQNDSCDSESIGTNIDSMNNQNDYRAFPGIDSAYPNCTPHELPMPPKYWTNATNPGYANQNPEYVYQNQGYANRNPAFEYRNRNPAYAVKPPPGFGPQPRYGAPFEVGIPGRVSLYQPWSTNSMDHYTSGNNPYVNQVNQVQCQGQLRPFYGYPTPVIVNYNVTSFILPSIGTPAEQGKNNEK